MTDISTDPRVLLALTLISLGVTTTAKLRAIWQAQGVGDAELDAILADVDQRLARRT